MKFQPTRNRVLVKQLAGEEQRSKGGILMTTKVPKNEAIVKAVGPGALLWDGNNGEYVTRPMEFKVGQKVWVPEHGMTEVVLEGETFHLISDDQVLAVLTEET